MLFRCSIALGIAMGLSCAAQAGGKPEGDIVVETAWARASIGAAKAGAAYLTITNIGEHADRLVAVATPAAARAELHTHEIENNIARMRAVEAIDLPGGGTTEMAPGGLHVMLFGLKAPLRQGNDFPLTLTLAHGGDVQIRVSVAAAAARAPASDGGAGLHVTEAWAYPTGARAGRMAQAYLTIDNRGTSDDRLLAVATPVAARAALHSFQVKGGDMIVTDTDKPVSLPAGKTHRMGQATSLVMLSGLSEALREGEHFAMTLTFEVAGKREIEVAVGRPEHAPKAREQGDEVGGHSHAKHDHGNHGHADDDSAAKEKTAKPESAGHKTHGGHGHAKHGTGAAKAHAHDAVIDIAPGPLAPTLSLEVMPADSARGGGWMVLVKTTNFTFARDKVDQPHVEGEGHAHIYVDGKKIGRVYDARHHLAELPMGETKVTVTLNANSHQPLSVGGEALTRTVTVQVP